MAQTEFDKLRWKFRYQHGGSLRSVRRGRKFRPLSTKTSIHIVFKAQRMNLKRGLRSPVGHEICQQILRRYAKRFFVKIEEQAICQDHIHLMIRLSRRSLGQDFFRVVAGQIAQEFGRRGYVVTDTPRKGVEKVKAVWKHRPFTRVVLGRKGRWVVRAYVRLNEKEASGKIPYRKTRLRGLSSSEWKLLSNLI